MPAKLLFAPEVEQDLADAYTWYEQRRLGLGEEFLSCVDACIETIRRAPELYASMHGAYRRALVRRFPYAIFYEYEAHTVSIYGILHTARHPGKWRERLL